MKRFITVVCLIILSVSLVGCKQEGKTNSVSVNIGKSSKFSQNELNSAVACIKNRFKEFEGCNLTDLWYDEVKSNETATGYIAHGGGSINAAKPENVIIFQSNFNVGSECGGGSLNPNSTYTDYKWFLVRDSKNGNWRVDDVGY